ncbi:hypothetical protein [Litorihabitans aurantiacus]|uniref:Uncharacterized protein n=1 Tax=Litorihabitans aurantiacus TaxID=1930061 RepID=A0AA37UHC5_9MICO|nr:hypothetical protein [Litorihabitans aurantiacus]GMA30489.1 hypothetical protein GCM10025875_04810 [Litorihabitans aurantiacus]
MTIAHTRRRLGPVALVPLTAALALAAACAAPAAEPLTAAPATPANTAADIVYAAPATLIQQGDGAPMACFGLVQQSYPPQCGGPELVGLSWEDVADAETAAGVTFGSGWLLGTYDGERFTLTEPVLTDAPPGFSPSAESLAIEQSDPLCDDPYRGGRENAYPTETFPEGESLGVEGGAALSALQERADALPGYVGTFVTDGYSQMNLVLADGSDVEAAHTSLREVWAGWLCVASRDVPTQAEGVAASDALSERSDGLDLIHWGPDALEGRFTVGALLADDATLETVRSALAPWYPADRIDVTPALRPFEAP